MPMDAPIATERRVMQAQGCRVCLQNLQALPSRSGRPNCRAMTKTGPDKTSQSKASQDKAARAARLAEQLRANLAKRKAQARARRPDAATDENPAPVPEKRRDLP